MAEMTLTVTLDVAKMDPIKELLRTLAEQRAGWRKHAFRDERLSRFLADLIRPSVSVTQLVGAFEVMACGQVFRIPVASISDDLMPFMLAGDPDIALDLVMKQERPEEPLPEDPYADLYAGPQGPWPLKDDACRLSEGSQKAALERHGPFTRGFAPAPDEIVKALYGRNGVVAMARSLRHR